MSLAKNALLTLVSVTVFFGLVEGGLALVGVEPALYTEDPLVGFSSRIPLFVSGKRRVTLHTAANKRALFNAQHFTRAKPSNVFRIFCLGGSTTYGRPYADATSFCGWLRELLPVADPSREWELINAGGISYASYRVAALAEELIEYEPDLFIIYSGHNEFLETRTYAAILKSSPMLLEARALLNSTRTYTVLRHVVEGVLERQSGEIMKRDVLPGEVEAVLDDSVGLKAYQRDDELAAKILAHYRLNLNRLVDIASSVQAEALLVTPASNLRSCAPFKTERLKGQSDIERVSWNEWMAKARRRQSRHRWNKALEAVGEAIAIDPRHAAAHYLRGEILLKAERYPEAREAFRRALDEDICPLRALSGILEIVAEVAEDRDVPLVDWANIVENLAEYGIPGEDLFLDHVHPTIEANRLLALEIIEKLSAVGTVRLDVGWNAAAIELVAAEVEGRLDQRAHARALTNLAKVFGWAGKHKEAQELALRALETVGDAETYNNAAMNALRLGQLDEAIGYYTEVLKRKPSHVPALSDLGFALAQQGRLDESLANLRKAVRLDPDYERSRYNLGHVLALKGRHDAALIQLGHALRINPKRGEYHMVIGNVLVEMGDLDLAIFHYRRAIAIDARLPKAHYRLAVVYLEREEIRLAAEQFRAVLALSPDSPKALTKLAWILSSHADADLRAGPEAVRFAERACRLAEYRDVEAIGALAASYAEVGRFEDAARTARQAVELASAAGQGDRAEAARQRLTLYESGLPNRSPPQARAQTGEQSSVGRFAPVPEGEDTDFGRPRSDP